MAFASLGTGVPELSIVIPAYNESQRINSVLDSLSCYLNSPGAPEAEVIIVDDGSSDGTGDLVDKWSVACPNITCLRHPRNRGKGAALRTGSVATRAPLLLFADADGATPIDEEQRLRAVIAGGVDLAIGSRMVDEDNVQLQRLFRRRIAGYVFSSIVRHLFALPVRDTQCGFKMLRRETVLPLVRDCTEDGYLFDIELLIRAHQVGLTIAELAVSWRDVAGSKIRLVRDSLAMLRGLIRLQHTLQLERIVTSAMHNRRDDQSRA